GHLWTRNQHRDGVAKFRLPDDLFIENTAAVTKLLDDALAVVQIVPESARVEQMKLVPAIAKQLADACIVEEQASVLIDDIQPGRAMFEDVQKLLLSIGDGLRR